jgi:sucrose 6(F)-phosphate phosphorylase
MQPDPPLERTSLKATNTNPRSPSVAPRPQLLTYPNSLGGDLQTLAELLVGPLAGLFHGVHILPPFPSSADRGFAPVTYREIDPRFGTWDDIERIAETHHVLLDVMINHLSRQSAEFQDFQRHGRRSPHADLFITLDKIWPDGDPPPADVAKIILRKPDSPFSTVTISDTGAAERVWTTFGTAEWSEQIDLDVTASATRALITEWLRLLAAHRVRIVRLDAVGYVIKKPGTNCFMVEPEIYEFLEWITGVANTHQVTLLPEVHDHYSAHQRLSAHGYWTYDFVLPGIVLDAFHTGRADRLATHLARSPTKQFTTLDCHDGIPVRPDLDGVLDTQALRALAKRTVSLGGNLNHIQPSADSTELDVHQLNCTYYSALDGDDDRYIAARAIQLFARGVPQIYYVGLLAGENDRAGVERTGEGRAVNRHDYTPHELRYALNRPVVKRLIELIQLRNTHPAFDGRLHVENPTPRALHLHWRHRGQASCSLRVNLATGKISIDDRGAA